MSAVTLVSLVGCIIILVVIIFLMVVICNVMSTKPGKKFEFVKMFFRNVKIILGDDLSYVQDPTIFSHLQSSSILSKEEIENNETIL